MVMLLAAVVRAVSGCSGHCACWAVFFPILLVIIFSSLSQVLSTTRRPFWGRGNPGEGLETEDDEEADFTSDSPEAGASGSDDDPGFHSDASDAASSVSHTSLSTVVEEDIMPGALVLDDAGDYGEGAPLART